MVIRRIREGNRPPLQYEVRKSELSEVLGDMEDASSLILLNQYLKSMEEDA
jgi:hypothetical protein